MAASLTSRARASAPDPRRYWAPCLGVALVAMSLFYVTLKTWCTRARHALQP